jgi:hypothetical protein
MTKIKSDARRVIQVIDPAHLAQPFALLAQNSVNVFDKAMAKAEGYKGTFISALTTAAVACVAADHGAADGKVVSRWLAGHVRSEGAAKGTLASGRSALVWKLTPQIMATIRREVGDPSKLTPEDFAKAVQVQADKLGNVGAEYKASKAAERDKAKADAVSDASGALGTTADEVDPTSVILAAIQALALAGDFDTLMMVREAAFNAAQSLTPSVEAQAA